MNGKSASSIANVRIPTMVAPIRFVDGIGSSCGLLTKASEIQPSKGAIRMDE